VRLTVGILDENNGWSLLLNQIGVVWEILVNGNEILPQNYSAVIVNRSPTPFEHKTLRAYLENGGALLSINGNGCSIIGSSPTKVSITTIAPHELPTFTPHDMIDVYSSGVKEKNFPADSEIEASEWCSSGNLGKGFFISVPFDFGKAITDARSSRKNFYFTKERLPSEVVARVSKGALRKLLTDVLTFLHHKRNLPFAHKWFFPGEAQTMFTFRVDSDKGNREEVMALHEVSKRYDVATMWFLDTKSHQTWLSDFQNFGNQEVGIHCYDHRTYRSREKNFRNFAIAQMLFHGAGLTAFGAAAPYGTWNGAIAKTFEEAGMLFSSEFSFDYDDFPLFPLVDGTPSKVLQIPIHPICPGSLRRASYSREEMKSYFRAVIEKKIAEREIISLYHHPTHHYNDVIEFVFQLLQEHDVQNISYSAYAAWWKKRLSQSSSINYNHEKGTLSFSSTTNENDVRWQIIFPDEQEAIVATKSTVEISKLKKQHWAMKYTPPSDISRTRKFDFRHPIINVLEEWYKRTQ
jgi:hypothetical protein